MGLTIHYGLKLDSDKTIVEAKKIVESLRNKCLDMPFKEVGELQIVNGKNCDWRNLKDSPTKWMLIQSCQSVTYTDGYGGVKQNHFTDGWHYTKSVSPKSIIAFSAWPGEGCEEANIGVCIYPKTIKVKSTYTDRNYVLRVPNSDSLSWNSFCKTQYASNPEYGGVTNFLHCHLLIVKMLDEAKKIGFDIECNDEGEYYEKRDLEALVKEIGEHNEFIAAFGGNLKDLLSESGIKLESSIQKYPNFEHLEADGQKSIKNISPNLLNLIQETAEISKTE